MAALFYFVFYNKHFRLIRRLQLVVALVVFAYMALSASPTTVTALLSDKVLHFAGNLLLIGSIWVAFYGSTSNRVALALAVTYSLSVEASQWFTHSRQADIYDALANLTGILVGFAICKLCEQYLSSRVFKAKLEEKKALPQE